MRSTFTGLNTMVRGIFNNQLSLDTTGHNITNAGTEGYSRQAVNSAATRAQGQGSIYGQVLIGTGVDAMSIQRARDIYADIQYRNENSTQQYYKTLAVNYDKLETIFDDSRDLGIEEAMGKFYQSWVDLSTTSSTAASRTQVIEQGRKLTNIMKSAVEELQNQINSEYDDIRDEVKDVNQILEHIVALNKQIISQEATGAMANDLRDQRDVLTDTLSNYVNISVTEDEKGAYQINSGGVTLVNGVNRTHLDMGNPVASKTYGVDYGIYDYNIKIVESNIAFIPQNGILLARFDAIAECKSYIDKLADIANFLLSAFNDQHKQGYDLDGSKKYVSYAEDGKETSVDEVDVDTTTRVEFVDSDGNYVESSNVRYVDGKYQDLNGNTVTKLDGENYLNANGEEIVTVLPGTVNFFGEKSTNYEYRRDFDQEINYLYKDDDDLSEEDRLLTGVQIIGELEVNSVFGENHGYRYVAATTSKTYKESTTSAGDGEWVEMEWGHRTGDGTNAVYLSELFNLQFDTITGAGKANANLLLEKCLLRAKDAKEGEYIYLDESGKPQITDDINKADRATAITQLSINSFYQRSMSRLGLDAHAVDVNYDAMEVIMTQIENWRDSTAGVDWNEELTNMIKFQKGYASCSRCLTTMDEMLDRLINNTGVVGR